MGHQTQVLKARWIFPVSSSPIENGWVDLDEQCIVALGNQHRPEALDLGDVTLVPGLLNTH